MGHACRRRDQGRRAHALCRPHAAHGHAPVQCLVSRFTRACIHMHCGRPPQYSRAPTRIMACIMSPLGWHGSCNASVLWLLTISRAHMLSQCPQRAVSCFDPPFCRLLHTHRYVFMLFEHPPGHNVQVGTNPRMKWLAAKNAPDACTCRILTVWACTRRGGCAALLPAATAPASFTKELCPSHRPCCPPAAGDADCAARQVQCSSLGD